MQTDYIRLLQVSLRNQPRKNPAGGIWASCEALAARPPLGRAFRSTEASAFRGACESCRSRGLQRLLGLRLRTVSLR